MPEKKSRKKTVAKSPPAIEHSLMSKTIEYRSMINKTIRAVTRYKTMDIASASQVNQCARSLETIYETLQNTIPDSGTSTGDIISRLQSTNDELSGVFRTYGTESIHDLVKVCYGHSYIEKIPEAVHDKWTTLTQHAHPIGYKLLPWKHAPTSNSHNAIISKNKIVEDFMIVEQAATLDCFDLARTSTSFQCKVYGVKVVFQNPEARSTLIVSAVIDDILVSCCELTFMQNKLHQLRTTTPEDPCITVDEYARFLSTLTLKDMLVYSVHELHQKLACHLSRANLIKHRTISQAVKEFIADDLYTQRMTLIQLLTKFGEPEFQYLAYLLYDLLSCDGGTTGLSNIDTLEQTMLYDSLPWNVKRYFRDAMKTTLQYTHSLASYDETKIPLEQQICLLKASDSVKEKAMAKLKEVKAKSEDTGSKARQYLEGLLRIPFGVYRSESILASAANMRIEWSNLIRKLEPHCDISDLSEYTTVSNISTGCIAISDSVLSGVEQSYWVRLSNHLQSGKHDDLVANVHLLNGMIRKYQLTTGRISHSGRKKGDIRTSIANFMDAWHDHELVVRDISQMFEPVVGRNPTLTLRNDVDNILSRRHAITNYLDGVKSTLDDAVHGHDAAKRQIQRVIGQWINGEHGGYCFGFEGPPGLGKTSLAKRGLAKCLTDDDESTRPFAFIAMGGSSNGSFLQGHSYTYVGSTWGKIVDILMDSKCMNPIIFIDELDKVSNTEHGKELIGILTHLIDGTQNDGFQDRYFSGIPIDLSQALFIFSYNDPGAIDRILLDRIHRVKFDALTMKDKLAICEKHILPEIFSSAGLSDEIVFEPSTIEWLVESYTFESGVRKLKEVLFEIITEINLHLLSAEETVDLPIVVTPEDIQNKYLKDRRPVIHTCIPDTPRIGITNGLWANALGKGGIIPIEATFFPSDKFLDFKLTGMQGDVMKESMNIARTLVWGRMESATRDAILKKMGKSKMQGLHIHCPAGATPKDGPSAGVAITMAMTSLLTNKPTNRFVGITGEVNLQGEVMAIGGLDLKIYGGIRGGVKTFLFPKENLIDFEQLMEKNKGDPLFDGIAFHPISTVNEAEQYVFSE